jgi:quercetin dioxygenase-like cupin family protein
VDASDGEVILQAGDVISLPTDVFRGFENVGDDTAFLYAILGGDDPGRVLWAPQVFDLARDYGLVLMEDGSLVDERAGESPPAGLRPMPRTTGEQVAQHRVVDSRALERIVIRSRDFNWRTDTALSRFEGVEEVALLGPGNRAESMPSGHLDWNHGFVLRALRFAPGSNVAGHRRREEEVLFVQEGELSIEVDGESLRLGPGDTFITPAGSARRFENSGDKTCTAYVTRRGDQPAAPEFT